MMNVIFLGTRETLRTTRFWALFEHEEVYYTSWGIPTGPYKCINVRQATNVNATNAAKIVKIKTLGRSKYAPGTRQLRDTLLLDIQKQFFWNLMKIC